MKVLFINIPKYNVIDANGIEKTSKSIGYYPPLGLLSLATYLKENSEHEVAVFDTILEDSSQEDIRQRIVEEKPEIIAITVYTPCLVDLITLLKIIESLDKNITVCLGGPHTDLYTKESLHYPGVDYVIRGEGEYAFKEIVDKLSKNEKVDDVKGISFLNDKREVVSVGLPNFIENIDELPIIDMTLVPFKKYNSILGTEGMTATIATSRGCPFRCTFCSAKKMGKYRMRSIDNVVKEVEKCIALGYKDFFLFDDLFNITDGRVKSFCEELLKREIRIKWHFRGRVNNLSFGTLKLAKEMGLQTIMFGIERGTDEDLRLLKKDIKVEQIKETIRITNKLKIKSGGNFMIGIPGDTKEKIEQLSKFICGLGLDYAQVGILIPYPYTDIYKEGLEKGIIKRDFWQKFAENPNKDFMPEVWTENMTREELSEAVRKIWRKFYLRPGYVLKSVLSVRSLAEIKNKVRGLLGVLGM